MTRLLNLLGPITHIFAALIPLAWLTAQGYLSPSAGLIIAVLIAALLPDIDSGRSFIGYAFGPLADAIEERFGHRTITHSLIALTLVAGFCWWLFPAPDWYLITAAYGSHLIIDMIVGQRGIALLWPMRHHFYFLSLRSRGVGELMVAILCAVLVFFPFIAPNVAQEATAFVSPGDSTATIPATPNPIIIRINHVYNLEVEILIQPGDTITQGQLIADLATWRTFKPVAEAAIPHPTPTVTVTPTPTTAPTETLTPTPTNTPTPTAEWIPDALKIAEVEAALTLAQIIATATAAPPDATAVAVICNQPETLRRKLWRDQIARDMGKAQAIAWEAIHVMEIDLDILEGDIAEADERCQRVKAQRQSVDQPAMTVAQARVEAAEINLLKALATPTPRPETRPTVTRTPTPTRTPTATATWTPTATITPSPIPTTPIEDTSRIYANISGFVNDVRIFSISGNQMTIEIDVFTDGYVPGINDSLSAAPLADPNNPTRIPATVIRVSDGDTLTVRLADSTEETIRLLGVDTPETVHPTKPIECYGPEASTFSKSAMAIGSTVYIETDMQTGERDKYDRQLAHVWTADGTLHNEALLFGGYARHDDYGTASIYKNRYRAAEATAKSVQKGLWGQCSNQ